MMKLHDFVKSYLRYISVSSTEPIKRISKYYLEIGLKIVREQSRG